MEELSVGKQLLKISVRTGFLVHRGKKQKAPDADLPEKPDLPDETWKNYPLESSCYSAFDQRFFRRFRKISVRTGILVHRVKSKRLGC